MRCFVLLLLAGVVTKGCATMLCEPDAYGTPPSSSSARPRLRRDLLCQYDRLRPPLPRINISTEVFVRRARVVHRTFVAEVLTSFRWQDRFLTWDPARYDGVEEVQISSDDIWVPSVAAYNTLPWLRGEGQLQADFWPVPCHVYSNGSVVCRTGAEIGGTCTVSYFYWPHMEADCRTYLGPDYRVHKNIGLTTVNNTGKTEMSYYVPGNAWIMTSMTKSDVEVASGLYVWIYEVKLHSTGATISAATIGPAVVLSVMLLSSFILPMTSYTRLGMCCCVIFGTVLATSLLLEYLQPYDDPTPIVVVVYTGLHVLSAIATLMVLLLNVVVLKSSKAPEAPRWLYSFQTWLFQSGVGKLWLKAMLLSPSEQNNCHAIELMPALGMQSGEIPGAVTAGSEENEDPSNGEAVSHIQMTHTQQSSGPHKIWEFTASFLNRCLCIIFFITFVILGFYLAYNVTIYNDPPFEI